MTTKITTETGRDMLQSVTPIYNNDELALAIFEANGRVMDEVRQVIRDLKYEMYPQNATWTLGYWENMLDIKRTQNLSDSERIQKVLFELNKYFPVTRKRLEQSVNTLVKNKDASIVEIENEYAFTVDIPSTNNIVISEIQELIEEMKPAHLLAMINLIHSMNTTLFFGGYLSFWNRIEINSIQFAMQNLSSEQFSVGYISTWKKHTIYPEVKHKWLITGEYY